MQTSIFSLQRVGYLLRSDYRSSAKRDLLLLAGLITVPFFFFYAIWTDSYLFYDQPVRLMDHMIYFVKFHVRFFPVWLLAGGFIYTSFSFRMLGRKGSRQFYLSLPASTLEKWFSKWLQTAVIFPLICLLLYQVFAQSTYAWLAEKGYAMVRLSPLDTWAWTLIKIYLCAQSFFLLIAVAFPRFSLVRSALILAGLLLLIDLSLRFGMDVLFPVFFEGTREWNAAAVTPMYGLESLRLLALYSLPAVLWKVIVMTFFPVLIIAGYLKLKEKEG